MTPALVQLVVLLAPYGTQIILALIAMLGDLVTGGHDVPTLAAVAAATITAVDLAHPGWTADERARCARDAIAVYAAKLKANA